MAGQLRIEYSGAIYHVLAVGTGAKQSSELTAACEKTGWQVLALINGIMDARLQPSSPINDSRVSEVRTDPIDPILVLVRFDHVALTDLTHFRIFPRNLAPDFTHEFSGPAEMSSQNNEWK